MTGATATATRPDASPDTTRTDKRGSTPSKGPGEYKELSKSQEEIAAKAMSDAQEAFLDELAGSATADLETGKKKAKQRKVLRDFTKDRAATMDGIKGAMDITLVRKNPEGFANLFGMLSTEHTVRTMDPDGNPNKELETGEAKMGCFEKIEEGKLRAIMQAQKQIIALQERLRGKQADGGTLEKDPKGNPRPNDYKPDPLFAETEIDGVIAKEVWQPLVTARIIPENAVPDKYSQVAQTMKGASDGYQGKLKKYSDTAPENDGALRKLALGQKVADGVNQMSGAVIQILKDQIPGGDAVLILKEVADLQAMISALSTVAFGAAEAGLKGEFDPKILANASTAILGALTVATDASPGLQTQMAMVGMAVSTALQSGAALSYLKKGNPREAVKCMGGVIAGVLSGAATLDGAPADANIAKDVQAAIIGVVDVEAAAEQFKAGKWDEAVKSLTDAMTRGAQTYAAQVIAADMKAQATEAQNGEILSPDEAAIDSTNVNNEIAAETAAFNDLIAAVTKAPEILSALAMKPGSTIQKIVEANCKAPDLAAAKKAWDKLTPEKRKAIVDMQAAAAKVEQKQTQKAAADAQSDEDKAAQADLDTLTNSPDVSELERLTAKVKLHTARYQLAVKLAALPFAVIGALVPPAKMGQALLEMATEFKAAYQAGLEYSEWAENVLDARRGGDVQAEAMTNRMELSLLQSVRHGIECSLKVIQIIGQGLTAAGGPVAPIGIAITQSAVAISSAKMVGTAIVDDRKASQAWRIYQKAQAQPSNRTAAREALRTNPTLAKFAIAYGAKTGNAFAENAMQKCGITSAMLQDERSGVDKLVEFLEASFSEDPVILRRIPVGAWFPGDKKIKLTGKSWMEFVAAAEANADLQPLSATTIIAAALSSLDKDRAAYEKAGAGVTSDVADSLLERILTVSRLVGAVKPMSADGKKPNREFQKYLDGLKTLVQSDVEEIRKVAGVLANAQTAFEYRFEKLKPSLDEALSLTPLKQSAMRKLQDELSNTLMKDVENLRDAAEKTPAAGPTGAQNVKKAWEAASAKLEQARMKVEEILDENADLAKQVASAEADYQDAFDQAANADQLDTAGLKLQDEFKEQMEKLKARKADENWVAALEAVDKAKDLADKLCALIQPADDDSDTSGTGG